MTEEWIPPTLEEKLESERLSKIRDKRLGFVHRETNILIDKEVVIPVQRGTNDPPTYEEKLEAEMLSKIRDHKLGFSHVPIYKDTNVSNRKDVNIQFNKDIAIQFNKDMITMFKKGMVTRLKKDTIPNREDMTAPFSKNLHVVKCPNCGSNETIILSVLRNGNRCVCEDCGETFVEWSKGINYVGNEDFNAWYGANKTNLYNIAEKLVTEIGEALNKKDYSDDYKIVATNIIIENMEILCSELGIKDLEEKISTKLKYKVHTSTRRKRG